MQMKCLAGALCDLADFRLRCGAAEQGELQEASDLLDRIESTASDSAWTKSLRKRIRRLQNQPFRPRGPLGQGRPLAVVGAEDACHTPQCFKILSITPFVAISCLNSPDNGGSRAR